MAATGEFADLTVLHVDKDFAVRTDGLAAVRSYLDSFWPSKLAALKAVVEAGEERDRG